MHVQLQLTVPFLSKQSLCCLAATIASEGLNQVVLRMEIRKFQSLTTDDRMRVLPGPANQMYTTYLLDILRTETDELTKIDT